MKYEIIAECARLFDVHPRDLLGHYRFGFLMPARFALYKALHMRGLSGTQIGRMTNRDRTTAESGIERANYMMERDPAFAEKVEHLATVSIGPKHWKPKTADVFNFVCNAAFMSTDQLLRTQRVDHRSYALACIFAKVALDAGLAFSSIAKTLGRNYPTMHSMAARAEGMIEAMADEHPDLGHIYRRAAKEFPAKKDVATADCMA